MEALLVQMEAAKAKRKELFQEEIPVMQQRIREALAQDPLPWILVVEFPGISLVKNGVNYAQPICSIVVAEMFPGFPLHVEGFCSAATGVWCCSINTHGF